MGTPSSSESTQICSSCEESCASELLYKCTQCNVSNNPKFLCDLCVAPHIKKKHPILDHRNLEPAVCSEHRQLCLDYCITCDEVSCAKCLVKHSKHEFKPLNEKASEVRAKVFEMLTVWEKNEKISLEKSKEISKIVDVHETETEQLVKEVESMLDKVKETLTAEIKSKFTEFKATENWVKDHVRNVGQTQSDLRGLLCQSNGSMVASISTVLAKTAALSTSQSKVELYPMNKEKFQTGAGFKSLHQKIVFEMRKELSLPGLKSKDPEPSLGTKPQTKSKGAKPKLQQKFNSIVGCFTDECFEVAQTNQAFEIRKYDTQKRKTSPSIVTEFDDLVASVDHVYYFNNHLVVVCSQLHGGGKQAFVCDVGGWDSRTPFWRKVMYPKGVDVLGPCNTYSSVDWFYWNPRKHEIEAFSEKEVIFRVQFKSRPVNEFVTVGSFPCFFDRIGKCILAFYKSRLNCYASCEHSYDERIDCISSFMDGKSNKLIIVTWSIESKASSVYFCALDLFGFRQDSIKKEARINWCSKECSLPFRANYLLKPLNIGDGEEEDYLFLIERINK